MKNGAIRRNILSVIAAVMMLGASLAARAGHRFICVDNDAGQLIHIDQTRAGHDWQVAIPKDSRDLQRLDGDRVLVGHATGCGIYSLSDGKCLSRVEGFKGVVSAQYRPDRKELWLGANTAAGYEFTILAPDGETFKKTDKVYHAPFKGGNLRLARFTPEGRLLFAAGAPARVVEWDPQTSKTTWEAPLPGKGYMAVRLSDGTTAASTSDAVSVVVFDRDGKLQKTWLGETVREKYRLKALSGFQFLPNGNLIGANWLGHNQHGQGPHLVEVDAQNKLVWSWEDHKIAHQVTNVLILDDPVTPAKQAAGKKAAAKTGAIKKPAAKKPRVSAKAEPATVALDEYGRLALEMTASKGWNTARLEREALRRDALILPTDRTPVDVVWRRTRSLLNHLRAMPGAPNLAAETAALGALAPEVAALQKEAAPAETQARALFTRITSLRRRIAFKNPLLDFSQILFVKRNRALFNHMCDQFYGIAQQPGGGLFILSDPFGPAPRVRDLLASSVVEKGRLKGERLKGGVEKGALKYDGVGHLTDPRAKQDGGTFLSPELSFDGKQILFAYVECRGGTVHRFPTSPEQGQWEAGRSFHIFKANIDGSGLEQLTDGPYNDFDPCWLPDGRIAFVSDRCGGYLRCDRVCPVYTLYDMDASGAGLAKLSYHETHEWQPSVGNDGMLVYTRWDYVDRDSDVAHAIWTSFPDGRDPRTMHGNYPERRELRPWMEMSIRSIPGKSSKYVSTAAPHHGQTWGSLVQIDLTRTDDRSMGQLRRITPEVPLPESEGAPGEAHPKGKHTPFSEAYGTAWPLSEDFYLCVYSPEVGLGASGGPAARGAQALYGIYLVDSFGNKELIYRDAALACMDPIPVKARPRPPVIPALRSRLVAGAAPAPATPPTAEVAVMNVYDGELPWPTGTKITALRIVNLFPKTTPPADKPRIGTGAQALARGVLGTVPVESDGSAFFTVPAGAPLYFQALDERGLAVQTMRSDTYAHPGERLSCIGCHETKHRASSGASRAMPAALRRAPSAITPEATGSYPLTFPRLVQPVLNQRCIACHDRNKKAPKLHGDRFLANGWSEAMGSLSKYAWGMSGGNGTALKEIQYSIPGQVGARASKLFALLSKGHHGVKLSEEELRRITLWLDCNSNFFGDYFETARQGRGEIVQPKLGIPAWSDFAGLVR